MSGVLVQFHRDGSPSESQTLERMLSAVPERGLHGADAWQDGSIALARQHFWITPEEWGERQPFTVNGITIAGDIRIDNRAELARMLSIAPEGIGALSDTALVAHAYLAWGIACVEKLLGDFVFAIWDHAQHTLYLARDPLGARGLVYYQSPHLFLAASEISQLLAHPAVPRRINEDKIAEYLTQLPASPQATFYQEILTFPPAHTMAITADRCLLQRYWHPSLDTRIRYRRDEDYAEHLHELMADSVRVRLRTTDPIGISMSGGLDSTSLAAVATAQLSSTQTNQAHLHSFSYAFDELRACDEREYIHPVVEQLGLDAAFIPCDERWPLSNFDQWPHLQDYVMADCYVWLPLSVMRAAQQTGCRLLLAGYYGDVLFMGGRLWFQEMVQERRLWHLLQTLLQYQQTIGARQEITTALFALSPATVKHLYLTWYASPNTARLMPLGADFVRRNNLTARLRDKHLLSGSSEPEHSYRYRSLLNGFYPEGLAIARRLYNQHGLEVVVPYWDRRLVEFVFALPADQLGRPGLDRWVLRNSMKGQLPENVRWRRKKTTFLPLYRKGIFERERDRVCALLQRPEIVELGYIEQGWLDKELTALSAPDGDDHFILWRCLSLELWLKRFWQ